MLARVFVLALLATSGNVTVDAVYPNPTTPGDTGEFVVLDVPAGASVGNLTLTDGEDTISLAGLPTGSEVAVAGSPGLARNITDCPVHVVDDPLALRNGGEAVTVEADGTPISTLAYPSAPTAELYRNGSWTPPGRSDLASPPSGTSRRRRSSSPIRQHRSVGPSTPRQSGFSLPATRSPIRR